MTKQQAEKKTVKFETEVSKLLDIVANSLYTEKNSCMETPPLPPL
jgi:HSP90 family molecular chaperone